MQVALLSCCSCDAGYVGTINECITECPRLYCRLLLLRCRLRWHHQCISECKRLYCSLPTSSMPSVTDVFSSCSCDEATLAPLMNASQNAQGCTAVCQRAQCPNYARTIDVLSSWHHQCITECPRPYCSLPTSWAQCPNYARIIDVLSGCSCDAGYVGTINASQNAQGCITVCQRAELNARIMQE